MKEQRGGFAKMDPARQREIARKGGVAAHQKGKAHQFTSEEARAAGRKGGVAVSKIPGHMSRIGRMGGLKSGARPNRNKKISSEGSIDDILSPLGEREKDPE